MCYVFNFVFDVVVCFFFTWYKMSVMIDSGLDISPVITHRMGYRDFQQGFDVMNSGEASKVVLNWQ